jgi:carbonic anhydrase
MKSLFLTRDASKATRRRISLKVESLETRLALSSAHHALPLAHHVHALATSIGTLKGRITNEVNGRGLAGVKVQLLDANNNVAATTRTGCRGFYAFKMKAAGVYVVHAVTPKKFTQTSPRFSTVATEGGYAINPATGQPYSSTSWSYRTGNNDPANGPVGPPFWGTVAPAGNEPFQSPINITGPTVDLGQYLTINYNDAIPSRVVNNGSQIQTQFNSTGVDTITLDGQVENLTQFHFHVTSENTVNGVSYPMEIHFVNQNAAGALSAVTVFVQLGAHNDALQPLLDIATTHLTTSGSSFAPSTAVNLAGLLPSSLQGWFFAGSLTTPPLSQVVNFLVLSTPITLDYGQLKQYEAVADGAGFLPNNRPIQPLDGRTPNQFNINVNYAGGADSGNSFTFTRTATAATAHVTRIAGHPRARLVAQVTARPHRHG